MSLSDSLPQVMIGGTRASKIEWVFIGTFGCTCYFHFQCFPFSSTRHLWNVFHSLSCVMPSCFIPIPLTSHFPPATQLPLRPPCSHQITQLHLFTAFSCIVILCSCICTNLPWTVSSLKWDLMHPNWLNVCAASFVSVQQMHETWSIYRNKLYLPSCKFCLFPTFQYFSFVCWLLFCFSPSHLNTKFFATIFTSKILTHFSFIFICIYSDTWVHKLNLS